MAPSHSRHLLVWTTLPIAVLLSYLWFRRKRAATRSDPGRAEPAPPQKSLQQELREADAARKSPPPKAFSRSLSGVDSAPIDIIFPPELKSAKSSQLIISDEDLDLEIEKIKSMKSSVDLYSRRKDASAPSSQPQQGAKNESARQPCQRAMPKQTSPRKPASPNKEIRTPTPAKATAESSSNTEMAQKDIVSASSIEKKINSLKMEVAEACSAEQIKAEAPAMTVTEHDIHRQSTERDSANHSPADVMLASPSLSSISDSHSEGSSDSGKGGSEVATPPSRTPACEGSVSGDVPLPTVYHFIIPQSLCGRLIGRNGSFVSQINNKTHARVFIVKHGDSHKLKICCVQGLQVEIESALEMIRDKFPEKRYPELTLEQVSFGLPPTVPLQPEQLCLKLVEGINNDTIVSCMVAPNHLFLQQPTHPTFPNLNILSGCMNASYADANSPLLPNPIPENSICAAYSLGAWYRALVLSTDGETEMSHVRFLDYGGYASIKNSDLRQIRTDFIMLPFQAAECFLSNIRPAGGDEAQWPQEAFNLVAELTKGAIIYTQVAEYTEDGIPLVLIYVALGPQRVVFLNGELVTRGYAEWIVSEQVNAEESIDGASA